MARQTRHLPKISWANIPKRIGSNQYNIPPRNIRTRTETIDVIKDHILASLKSDEKLLIGFDFAFGYPAGTAEALGTNGWESLWAMIHDKIKDTEKNVSNRFRVAEELNHMIGSTEGPFWGHPHQRQYQGLKPKKPLKSHPDIKEFREVERRATSAKSVWQLAYNGAVGSQTLLGIASLERLRRDPEIGRYIAIWPFETNFADDINKPIIFAEIYPSSHQGWKDMPFDTADAQQVAKICEDFKLWDSQNLLKTKLSASNLTETQRYAAINEEGWIIGQ